MTDRTVSTSDPDNLDAAEARSERIRADLADTVGELRRRLSPSAIKDDVTNRVVHSGQDRFAKLQKLVKDNPLQAVAVGAGAAYPIFGILRRIPAPFLLMGAGVAIAGRNGWNGTAQSASGRAPAADVVDRASAAANTATDRAGALAGNAARSVSDAAATVSDRVSALGAGTADAAGGLASAASEFAEASYESGVRAVSAAGERLSASGQHARNSVLEAVDKNPFVLAGLAVLAGAAVAAMLPASRTEARLFGEASDDLKQQAKAAADEAMDAVATAGSRVVDDTLKAASEQGLDPETARHAVRDVADKAGAVVDKALAGAAAPSDRAASNQSADAPNPSRS